MKALAPVFTLFAALLFAPAVALAGDMPVTYVVNRSLLVRNAPAGTLLTFELHTDSTCTSAVHTETIVIENPNHLIEQVNPVQVQGGPPPPSVARLNFTLTNVTPQPAFFLEVTGTGISPIGQSCQPQPLFFTEPLVPSGIIVLQDETSCPPGYTLLVSHNNKVLVAADTAGISGGSNTHAHGAGSYAAPIHTHGTGSYAVAPTTTHGGGCCGGGLSNPPATTPVSGTSAPGGDGPITGTSAAADSRPEFKTILLCKKD